METQIKSVITAILILFCACPLQADTDWYSGHHEIFNGDVYSEIWMYNDCTLDIFGGDIYRLAAYGTTFTNWYDGQMNTLWARDDSTVNIYGGGLDILAAAENSSVNLYAYDVIITTTGGVYNFGYVMGKYYTNNDPFYFDIAKDAHLHINIIPEPTTLLLLSLGCLLLRKKR